MKNSSVFPLSVLQVLAVIAVTLTALPSAAITITVRNNNDVGAGSLRQAISDNTALGGTNTIVFSNIVTGTITLTGGELAISKDVAINGPGASVLTVSGNTNSRIFNITATDALVSISGLTLANGSLPLGGGGGCIQSLGNLTLTGCTLSNNSSFAVYGAAIYNEGSLTIRDSIVCSNRSAFASGGGLYHHGGTATIVNSTFYGNAGYQGGALNNQGGVTMLLTNCTVFANSGDAGGGIYNVGQLFVRNCTIVSNNAAAAFANSRGGGVYNDPSATADVGSTIIAGNTTATNTGPDCFGNFTSIGYNLIGRFNGSGNWNALGDQVGTISSPLNPMLGPLQDNGGPTPTLAPLPGSPVLDQGKSVAATDQRGRFRRADFSSSPNATDGDGSDIGSVEIWPGSPALNIRRAGNNVVLSWAVAATDFRLQSATNLPASNSWSVAVGTPVIADGQYTLTNAASGGRKTYRLFFP